MKDGPKTPLYRHIAQALRTDIAEGAYAQGEKLPTEARLAARFGVNRHTVRHALGVLAEEGVVRARRGSGTTVIGQPIDYRLGTRVRFRSNLLGEGLAPDRELLSVELRAATAHDARVLKLDPGADVCVYRARTFADGAAMAIAESRFPEQRLQGLSEALRETNGVTRALAHVGVQDYTRASTRLTAERASPFVALHLGLSEGDPVLYASSVNVDAAGQVVEYGQTWFAGGRVVLTVDQRDFTG